MARTPMHSGALLRDALHELGISAAELARLRHVPANRVSHILSGTGPQLWRNLQQAYDLDLARQQLGEELEAIEPRVPVAVHA